MSKLTNAETARLRVAILEKLYPIALKARLSSTQLEDIAHRVIASGKVFLKADDTLTGHDIDWVVDDLRNDPKNAHLFRAIDEEPNAKTDEFIGRFGMSKAEFDTLPARRRLELANAEAAKGLR